MLNTGRVSRSVIPPDSDKSERSTPDGSAPHGGPRLGWTTGSNKEPEKRTARIDCRTTAQFSGVLMSAVEETPGVTENSVALPPTVHEAVDSRAWVVSDLQTSSPEESRRVLTTAITDIQELTPTLDQLWYLGDAVSGADPEPNREVAGVQIEHLDELGVPSRYVMGNHDIDPPRKAGVFEMPFYECARDNPNWRTTESPDDFYFVDELGGHTVLFLSDHVSPDMEWSVTHGRVRGDDAAYPYTEADYRAAIEAAGSRGKPLIIAGHNAFSGGNRPAGLQDRFLPLPLETVLHLYGHAHIGDERRLPSGSGHNAYRTISYVDHHQVPQVDVASLEDRRGDVIRSAILETYVDGGCAVHLRDHSRGRWIESYHSYSPERAYLAWLSDGSTETRFVSQNQNQQVIDIVEFLGSDHDLFERLELPYADDQSGLRISTVPKLPDGSDMRNPHELSNGLYLERRFEKPSARDAIRAVTEATEFTVEFDGLWLTGGP